MRLSGLDALRGIAALVVLGWHVQAAYDLPPLISRGYLAVDFFFMLSGYVLARAYEPKLAKGFAPAAFIRARLRRLWPTMLAGGLIGSLVLASLANDPVVAAAVLVANLLFLPVSGGVAFPLNAPMWSLHMELAANVAHAFALRFLSTRALLVLAGALVLSLAALNSMLGGIEVGNKWENFALGYLRVLASYTIGIALWRIWQDRPPFRVPPFVTYAALPVLLTVPVVPDWLFVALACPLLIAGGLNAKPAAGYWLGALSFPLYAVHFPIIIGVQMLGGGPLLCVALALIVAAAFCLDSAAIRRAGNTGWRRPRWSLNRLLRQSRR